MEWNGKLFVYALTFQGTRPPEVELCCTRIKHQKIISPDLNYLQVVGLHHFHCGLKGT